MSDRLRIAPGFGLPIEAVTETFGIYGQRGTGKSNTAAVIVEEIAKAGGYVVIFDPVGAWWGITRDGTGKGLPGVVIGGEHADVPLEETGGHLVAELLVARHWRVVVVDTSLLRKGARRRFMVDCLEDLYHANREALMVVLEEAHEVLPQTPRERDPIISRLIGAAEDIAAKGRGRGLGFILISQRFAAVNTNVREQVGTLVVLRLMGPRDRRAAKEWIEANGDPAVTATVLDSLAMLQPGQAWLYSPAWLDVLERVTIRRRRTFDSGATPKVGQPEIKPGERAKVNLDELRDRMAATIERVQAEDPKRLQARIRELEREIAQRPTRDPEPVKVPVLANGTYEELRGVLSHIEVGTREFQNIAAELLGQCGTAVGEMRALLERIGAPAAIATPQPAQRAAPSPSPRRAAPEPPPVDDDVHLRAGAVRILETLAGLHPMTVTKAQVGTITGFKITGGTFQTYWSTLKRAGYVSEQGGEVTVTEGGLARVGAVAPAPATTEEMIAMWGERLRRGAREMLDHLVAIHPDATSKDDLADYLGMTASGGTFQTYLSTLRRNGLADVDGQYVRAGDALFITGGVHA